MNRFTVFLLIVIFNFAVWGQTTLFRDNGSNDPVKIDSRQQQFEYVPGQILVKFKDPVMVKPSKVDGLAKSSVASVDAILQRFNITTMEKVFEKAEPLKEKRLLKDFAGNEFEQPNLHNIYKLELKEQREMLEAIETFKNDPNIEYAEPNYILSIVDAEPVSDILTEEDIQKLDDTEANTVTPNDPLYSEQWYIPAIKADAVWDSTTGDTTQIIGILDTGVDWLHPDLENNIWINYTELNGSPGFDDDANGFIDDIRGWDFINNDNDPKDDNSHGTHVAGIAAAEGNNGIGIAGVNWHAKIMPIKVFQSSGRGDVATITQGIWYAINKGATVINMSFGTYSRSLTMEDALAYAYAQAVLVAAAGNDGTSMAPCGFYISTFFPAALSYVLGVEAENFSNFDCDGPFISIYPELFNYELKAPGANIISTVPNGNYRAYSGSSMATPIVSAGCLLYRLIHPNENIEQMWVNLINSRGIDLLNYVNFSEAIMINPPPRIYQVEQKIIDTLATDNSDGIVDAGETIELWYKIRNVGGHCDSAYLEIKFGEYEDTTMAQIIKSKTYVGSMSPYAMRYPSEPLVIKINPNVSHNRDIVFEGSLWYRGANDTTKQRIIINVTNATKLIGILDSNLTLTPDRNWIIQSSFRISSNGILNIKPGTKLDIISDLNNRGKLNAIGTADSMITIKGPGSFTGNGEFNFQYVNFKDLGSFGNLSTEGTYILDRCVLYGGNSFDYLFNGKITDIKDCVFKNWNSLFGRVTGLFNGSAMNWGGFSVTKSNFEELMVTSYIPVLNRENVNKFSLLRYNNFVNLSNFPIGNLQNTIFSIDGNTNLNQSFNNFIIYKPQVQNIIEHYIVIAQGGGEIINMQNQYWGTNDSIKISNEEILDFFDNPNLPMIRFWPYLTAPSDSAHGIVWKVLVDGIDPQDEKKLMNPIGVGPHRFDVYFNRPMDTTFTPQLSFGVREPYTQQFVSDSARWSPDGRIWTAYKTVQLYTGDGINRIRVTGAKDPEGFEIPIEDMRFEFLIDAAGTSSEEFVANPGLGKIELTWVKPDVPDILGYNMYRFTNLTDTTYTDTTLISENLITDTTFTDFNVIPGKNYYYTYKVVRTNFSESDYSKIVGTKALTSDAGDANGDLAVNVLDIISIVSYILQQNPQPFIFDAADINRDSVINILDLVATINLILQSSSPTSIAGINTKGDEKAIIKLDREDASSSLIKLKTTTPIAGLQLKIAGWKDEMEYVKLQGFKDFEIARAMIGKDTLILVIYNLSGKAIEIGEDIPLLKINSRDVHISSAVLAKNDGSSISVDVLNNGESIVPETYVLNQNYPNPFNSMTTIRYGLPQDVTNVQLVIYNILGQKIRAIEQGAQPKGYYQVVWDGKNNHNMTVASGVYFCQMRVRENNVLKVIGVIKMMLLK